MKISQNLRLLPRMIGYKLAYHNLINPPAPINFTFSVTNMCQSRCKTCNIWQLYQKNPKLKEKEMTIEEIEKMFKTFGATHFFNISGGEPFLRQDLPEIIELACKYLKPKIIHTPTNAIAPELIEKQTRKIMEIINKCNPKIIFTIKPSFDGIGSQHDKIRGIKGNFAKVLDTLKRLRKLKEEYPNLEIGLGTVISRYNHKDIEKIAGYAKSLNPDSYINEIAEHRSELFNENDPITPNPEDYEKVIQKFEKIVREDLKTKPKLTRLTQAFRLEYYKLALEIMKQKKQVIPCYAGIASVHINPYGDVWPCCIIGYKKPMGNLRDFSYDFKKLWRSDQARKIRNSIKNKSCYCPLANIAYTNILMNPKRMVKVIKNILKN